MSEERDVGQGYPEEQPGGAGGSGENPEKGTQQPPQAPESKPDRDSGPETATGNPGAAG